MVKYEHLLSLLRPGICAYFLNPFPKCVIVDPLTFKNCDAEVSMLVQSRALCIYRTISSAYILETGVSG